jgi:hypothetical protein
MGSGMVVNATEHHQDPDHLFVPGERLGWIYQEQPPPRPCGLAAPPPYQPNPAAGSGCSLLLTVPVIALVTFGTWRLGSRGWGLGVMLVLAFVLLIVKAGERLIAKEEAEAQEAHLSLVETYQRAVAEHDELERRRVEAGPVWFPLRSQTDMAQLQVFGGTARSMQEFIVCVGSGALAEQQSVMVVDLTRSGVAGRLLALTRLWGRALVRQYQCPRDVNMLVGSVNDVPDYLADAFAAAQGPTGHQLRSAYANLLHVVCGCLCRPLTVARLAEGLRLLQRIAPGPDPRLDDTEQQRLLGIVDSVGDSEAQRGNLQYLCDELEALARVATASSGDPMEWSAEGPVLTVLSTANVTRGRKALVDALAAQFVMTQLVADAPVAGTIVIAGADLLDTGMRDDLQAEARHRDVRLVWLFDHLQKESLHQVGGSGTGVAFMELGNHKDAVEAAEFIGRGHKYVLSQLTHSVGETRSEGLSTTDSVTRTTSRTTGTNWGTTVGRGEPSHSNGGSQSFTGSRSVTRGRTRSESVAHATNDGTTEARVYEFEVEPTTLQALPSCGLLLVDNGPRGRRVVTANCDSAIASSPRVSALPAEDVTEPSATTQIDAVEGDVAHDWCSPARRSATS